jgi:hypothetical protein
MPSILKEKVFTALKLYVQEELANWKDEWFTSRNCKLVEPPSVTWDDAPREISNKATWWGIATVCMQVLSVRPLCAFSDQVKEKAPYNYTTKYGIEINAAYNILPRLLDTPDPHQALLKYLKTQVDKCLICLRQAPLYQITGEDMALYVKAKEEQKEEEEH